MTPAHSDETERLEHLNRQAAAMLRRAGFNMEDELDPMAPGGNNRVYLARGSGGPWVVKHYFRDATDPRDRLTAEWSFARFARDHDIAATPRPLAKDEQHGLAAYEHIPGRALKPGEPGVAHMTAAADFIAALAACRRTEAARALPDASEACFSLADHCACVDRRIARLSALTPTDDADAAAQRWIGNTLLPAWQVARRELESTARCLPSWADPLHQEQRVISPSDFGFHNAIVEPGGRLRFIDFEYAGWDDPAKLVCDFFCQPAVPAPRGQASAFASSIAALTPDPMSTLQRMELLMPVYRIKWCCILLNIFLPPGARRRQFAGSSQELHTMKELQLRKAMRSMATSALPA